jgi:hypothetical protein
VEAMDFEGQVAALCWRRMAGCTVQTQEAGGAASAQLRQGTRCDGWALASRAGTRRQLQLLLSRLRRHDVSLSAQQMSDGCGG